MLHEKVKSDIIKGSPTQKGDWKPLLFLFTDGKPNDGVAKHHSENEPS